MTNIAKPALRNLFLGIIAFLFSGVNPDVSVFASAKKTELADATQLLENSTDFFCAATSYRFAFGKEENTAPSGSSLKNEKKNQLTFSSPETNEQSALNYLREVITGDFPGFQFSRYLLFRKLLL